ncbi:NAD(P)-dependent dehydrogenase (short-subunit alcohol dehydrogenase family) [Mucilaginibacter yixingensis]|uniref:NAD(P)-dependent dehydrogenase (Short-subunit alcohol dehydrogenase family) n=1 Tax=Mucilaginibacter yixingensis TaxID=1295612 RepID=A0A2T5JE95_9SPHI|nr:SDR family oxidoreductase [Mucilaginibacter yixingensis]PTR00090.1 NAD(P)-dependent dehydrogenase (short-subunit alcohol dehydrogenase family) [Mucilaginibacter yixingensis]
MAKTPAKQNRQPGIEAKMAPAPEYIKISYAGSGKLRDKVALITGGDSGIGRAVSIHFAREGADVAIVYLNEDVDAKLTKTLVEAEGRKCLLLKGDVKKAAFCKKAVATTVSKLKKLNILVNNAGIQIPQKDPKQIDEKQLEDTFRTNIFAYFHFANEALEHLGEGDCIINTTSVTAYRSSPNLIDYSSTKGAITSFTRSLATNLTDKKIRVNAVAPGPVWTPLIVATFDEEKIKSFGSETAMKRAGQPSELAPAYVFLASDDASFITGQVIHVNGGEVVNG